MQHVLVIIAAIPLMLSEMSVASVPDAMKSCWRDSSVTTVASAEEPFGIGYVQNIMVPGGCSIVDGETEARFGYNLGASYRAWIAWSLAPIPDDAEVLEVEVEHYVWPPGDPDHQTQYRALPILPGPGYDCDYLFDVLNGQLYTQYYTGTDEGWRRETLGGSAAADVDYLLTHGDRFCLGVTSVFELTGAAVLPGWSEGGASLIVTWRTGTPVGQTTWTMVKSLYLD